jgi:hypothetical protein
MIYTGHLLLALNLEGFELWNGGGGGVYALADSIMVPKPLGKRSLIKLGMKNDILYLYHKVTDCEDWSLFWYNEVTQIICKNFESVKWTELAQDRVQ